MGEGVRSAREAARVLREDRQDGDRAEEDRLGEEQVGEDREQEEEPCGEEECLVHRFEKGARCPEDQGVCRAEEGHPAVREGEGVHGLRTTCVSSLGGQGACSGMRELPAPCLSDGRGGRGAVQLDRGYNVRLWSVS